MNSFIKETLLKISDVTYMLKYLGLKGPAVCVLP